MRAVWQTRLAMNDIALVSAWRELDSRNAWEPNETWWEKAPYLHLVDLKVMQSGWQPARSANIRTCAMRRSETQSLTNSRRYLSCNIGHWPV